MINNRIETFVISFEGEEGQAEFARLMEIHRKGAPGVNIKSISRGNLAARVDEAEGFLHDCLDVASFPLYSSLDDEIENFLRRPY